VTYLQITPKSRSGNMDTRSMERDDQRGLPNRLDPDPMFIALTAAASCGPLRSTRGLVTPLRDSMNLVR